MKYNQGSANNRNSTAKKIMTLPSSEGDWKIKFNKEIRIEKGDKED